MWKKLWIMQQREKGIKSNKWRTKEDRIRTSNISNWIARRGKKEWGAEARLLTINKFEIFLKWSPKLKLTQENIKSINH